MSGWGEWIKNKRECADMTQSQLSRALGKTGLTFVNYIEKGTIPNRAGLELLARALDVPLDEMLLAAGIVPDEWQTGVRRNVKEVKKFLKRMQKV